ncbi:MAG TPA: ankyrin repeat domain-containing protein [Herpetosiphonaceae bacterium]
MTIHEHPLMDALLHRRTAEVRALLVQGRGTNRPDSLGKYPFWVAMEDDALFRLLLDHQADVTVRDRQGDTILHRIAEDGVPAHVPLVLAHGLAVDVRNAQQQTPLHAAAAAGHGAVAAALLAEGADVNAVDARGQTPLHYAVYGAITPMTVAQHAITGRLLLQAGANPAARLPTGETPRDLALLHGYPELHALFERLGD